MILHLFFALFLFGRDTEQQARVIRRVLDNFCGASGEKVIDKSFIYPHGSSRKAQKVGEIFGIAASKDLGKYLGLNLWSCSERYVS